MDPFTWSAVGRLALRHWYVAPIAALAAALMLTRGTLESRTADRDAWRTQSAKLEQRNSTTQASLDGALARIRQQNKDAEDAAARYQADRTGWAADLAALSERYRSTSGLVARLEASARATPTEPCKPSAAALDALKEL